MRTKEAFIAKLRSDPLYKRALESAKSDEERKKIASMVEGFVSVFAGSLAPMIAEAQDNPTYASKLREALSSQPEVVNNKPVSGSKND